MASLIETLIDVLDKENTEYQGLLKLSEEKTTAIVNGNVERLQEILDHWAKTCGVSTTYYESHKYKVRIPWEDYNKRKGKE